MGFQKCRLSDVQIFRPAIYSCKPEPRIRADGRYTITRARMPPASQIVHNGTFSPTHPLTHFELSGATMMKLGPNHHRRWMSHAALLSAVLWLGAFGLPSRALAGDDVKDPEPTPEIQATAPPEAAATEAESEAADTEPAAKADEKVATETVAGQESTPAPPPLPKATRAPASRACKGGWIADDGSADAGYGFVPSARVGVYVQEIHSEQLPSRRLDEVCVCLYKGLARRRAEFDIVFYEEQNGRPATEPYASLPARARIEAKRFREAKHYFQVDASSIEIPEGASYIGVRWDPKEQFHLFICGDKTADTAAQKGFFTEDRAKGWTNIATSRDPMFRDHRALLVRARSQPPAAEKNILPGEAASPTGEAPAGETPAGEATGVEAPEDKKPGGDEGGSGDGGI